MNVFADAHHMDLFLSLQFLFETRLGGRLFRPASVEWFEKGYWRLAELYGNHPDTIKQFLELRGVREYPYIPPFTNLPLNKVIEEKNDHFVVEMQPYDQRVVTPEQFFKIDMNYVIASHPLHIESFKRLCNEHPSHPKLIFQIGNEWNVDATQAVLIDGVMASACIDTCPKPVVIYHQEFDTKIFCYKPPVESNKISAILHCFDVYPDASLFYMVEVLMPELVFKAYGATSRDGVITGHQALADEIHASKFIWHVKSGGDGFGHIIHNAFACGRPPIIKRQYYQNKLAEKLMIDGVTCLEIDGLNANQIVNKIRLFSEPEKYKSLCENAYNKFREVVDYDREEQEIRNFLTQII